MTFEEKNMTCNTHNIKSKKGFSHSGLIVSFYVLMAMVIGVMGYKFYTFLIEFFEGEFTVPEVEGGAVIGLMFFIFTGAIAILFLSKTVDTISKDDSGEKSEYDQ